MVPSLTPSLTSTRTCAPSQASQSSTSPRSLGPPDIAYLRYNLRRNHIFVELLPNELPQHVRDHMAEIRHKHCSKTPDLNGDDMATYLRQRQRLDSGYRYQPRDLTRLLVRWLLPDAFCGETGLACALGVPMSAYLTPKHPSAPADATVCRPRPGLLYGYTSIPDEACPFTKSQLIAQRALDQYPGQRFVESNRAGLQFPFICFEIAATWWLWPAINRNAGTSAACLNAVERLNDVLRQKAEETGQPAAAAAAATVDNLVYSVVVYRTSARLYVSWKPADRPDSYRMHEVGRYWLADEAEVRRFRRRVHNIFDWGMGERLAQIRNALDVLSSEEKGR
ncbi:6905828c-32f9-4995-87dc-f3b4eef69c08 [Thermothielavioides terrestris]|uniref:6905828c-32f9-4995-87dc-f3b4eef69c08 n=1 Tax=Thermothielavioides terrestris TaxID=2587410 RepID=A0A3S4AST9_9PEZI|nr:6905828c-32f9-4995-87dc-f3b4eef69c08 [Thermothielavioides terrestris]